MAPSSVVDWSSYFGFTVGNPYYVAAGPDWAADRLMFQSRWYVYRLDGVAVDGTPRVNNHLVVSGPCGFTMDQTQQIFNNIGLVQFDNFNQMLIATNANPDCRGAYTYSRTMTDLQTGTAYTEPSRQFVIEDNPPRLGGGISAPPAIARERTYGCGNQLQAVNPTAHRGDPVDTATGSFCESITDLTVPNSPGVPFSLVRSYNSLDSSVGVLGQGWTTNLSSSLSVGGDGKVTVRATDGQQLVYTPQPDGSYAAPPGAQSQLTVTDAGYRLQAPHGLTFNFDGSGALTSELDGDGQGLTYSYADGRLSTVTDAAGRSTTLSYGSNGLLASATLADGRSVNYGYTGNQLTSVQDVRGNTWNYGYDDGGRLSSIEDPLGNFVTRNTYDPATGRVTAQRDALGQQTTFGWNSATSTATTTEPNGGTWTDVYRNNVLFTSTDPLGHRTTYRYDNNLHLAEVSDARGNLTDYGYNSAGDLVVKHDASGSATTFSYDTDHNLTGSTDPNNNTTTLAYNGNDQLTQISDAAGGSTRFAYTSLGQIATITDKRNKITHYGYDNSGNATSITSPAGETTHFGYDAAGRLTSRTDGRIDTDPAGNYTTTYTYNAADQMTSVTDARGHETSYDYDANGNRTSVTLANGDKSVYAYDADNRLTSTTLPGGGTTTRTYDAIGDLTSVTDPVGDKTTYLYDLAGRRTSMTTPNGNVGGVNSANFTWTYTYDNVNNLTGWSNPIAGSYLATYDTVHRRTQISDPTGAASRWVYDPAGNVIATLDRATRVQRMSYDELNRVTAVVDGNGNATTYSYDAAGDVTQTVAPSGATTTASYDDDGRLATVTAPRGNVAGADASTYTTSYDYDPANNVIRIATPGATTVQDFDADNNLIATTSPTGNMTTYGYDQLDRLATSTDPLGHSTTYRYDSDGHISGRVDANGHAYRYDHDLAGRLTTITDPLGFTRTSSYDADGNVTQQVIAAPLGGSSVGTGSISYRYDQLDRLTAIDYSDGTPSLSFGYNNAGCRTSMTDGTGTTSYGNNPDCQPTRITTPSGTFAYTYDQNGNVVQRQFPDGTTINESYDGNNSLNGVSDGSATTTYGYDADGNLTSVALPNGITQALTYDPLDRVASVTNGTASGTLSTYTYGRDADGQPTSQTALTSGSATAITTSYKYDADKRLTDICTGGTCDTASSATQLTYDAVGNRTSQATTINGVLQTAGMQSYVYNDDDELVSLTTGTATGGPSCVHVTKPNPHKKKTKCTTPVTTNYSYDANGNQTSAGDSTYAFNLADQLTAYQSSSHQASYSYDGVGNRAASTVDGVTTTNLWDTVNPYAQLAVEQDGAGNDLRVYIPGAFGPQSETTTTGTYYYDTDGLNNVVDLTDVGGHMVQNYSYDAFGNATAADASSTAPDSHITYDSQYLDPESGDYNLRAREYDPRLGRFLSTDPLASASDTQSSYLYGSDSPLSFDDPTGQSFCPFGHRADGSCNLGGIGTDLKNATEGVGKGVYNFGRGAADAVAHPVQTVQNLASACEQGFSQYGHDIYGVLGCIDNVNPAAGIRRGFHNAYQLAERGCVEQSSAAFTEATLATAAYLAPLAIPAAGAAAAGTDALVVDIDQLSSAQLSNYARYLKGLPKGADYPTITRLPDGSTQFSSDVPATNIPGSYATYTKVVGKDGSTITYYKTTIAPDGSTVSVKVKYP